MKSKWKIYCQDVIEWANSYNKGKFHALLTDAPYHLESIVKRFGKTSPDDDTKTSEVVRNGSTSYGRLIRTGFMGEEWDGGDIAFRPETWSALGEHLYPGAFGMSFSASRNWHRMAVAIEDAGFILHPTIFLWAYGQGFPKATNIHKQLEKKGQDGSTWEGHRYGLQALKPAVEPIIVFQKPYEGKPLDNILDTGAGALNIDGTRIPLATGDEYSINTFDDGAKPFGGGAGHKYISRKVKEDPRLGGKGSWKTDKAAKNVYDGGYAGEEVSSSPLGRWPSNLILDGDAQDVFDGASRFFLNVQEQLDESDPVYYCSKVSQKERNVGLDERNPHPTLKPISLMKYLATLLLPPVDYAPRRILVPFSGVCSEMIGAGLAGWEHIVGVEFMEKYVEVGEKRMEYYLNENN